MTPSRIVSVLRVFSSNLWMVADGPAFVRLQGIDGRPFGQIKHACFACGKPRIVAGGDGQGKNALADVLKINLDIGRLLFFRLIFISGFVFVALFRLLSLFFVAFRRQRRR